MNELESGESSLLAGNAHPELFPEFKIEGYDYLEASLAVEDKAASVTWAPFLFRSHYSWLSETRVKLGQADGITSLGLSLKHDPLNPRSKNGIETLTALGIKSDDPQGLNAAKALRVQRLNDKIFNELSQKADANCTIELADIECLRTRVLEEKAYPATGDLLYEIHCGLRKLKSEIEDLQVQIENEKTPAEKSRLAKKQASYSRAFSELTTASERSHIAAYLNSDEPSPIVQLRGEVSTLSKEIEAAQEKWAASTYTAYRERLYSSAKPVLSISYSTSFFKVLRGGETDSDGDELNDNEHRTKSRSLSVSADWRISDRNGLSLLWARSNERASAEEGSTSADYDGLGLTWAYRVKVLNEDGYRKSKDYKESLFVPSIVFGLALEQKECKSSNPSCIDGIVRTRAVTPFIDFKIRKAAQFRIGIPLRRDTLFRDGGEVEEDSVDIVSLVAFQLGSPG